MAENDNVVSPLIGMGASFVLGGLVGAAVALLFAPATGEETREKLSSWIGEGRQKTKEYLAEKRETLAEKKEQFAAAFEAGKKAYREAKGEEKTDLHEHRKTTATIG